MTFPSFTKKSRKGVFPYARPVHTLLVGAKDEAVVGHGLRRRQVMAGDGAAHLEVCARLFLPAARGALQLRPFSTLFEPDTGACRSRRVFSIVFYTEKRRGSLPGAYAVTHDLTSSYSRFALYCSFLLCVYSSPVVAF